MRAHRDMFSLFSSNKGQFATKAESKKVIRKNIKKHKMRITHKNKEKKKNNKAIHH